MNKVLLSGLAAILIGSMSMSAVAKTYTEAQLKFYHEARAKMAEEAGEALDAKHHREALATLRYEAKGWD
mgnify:FL=1